MMSYRTIYSIMIQVCCVIPSFTRSLEPVYEGCYGIDLLVSKVPQYTPTPACWERCLQEGTQQVLVYGIRWCGCPSNGVAGWASADCDIQCLFLPVPHCVCFHGHDHDYDRVVQLSVHKHISKLPPSAAYQGYNCIDMALHDQIDIFPGPAQERAHSCLSTKCRQENRKYGAYMMGYKCGCRKSGDPLDDSFLPVTRDCVDRMVCMELPESVCLCGNKHLDSQPTASVVGVRPLLISDRYQCYLMKEEEREAVVKRIVEYEVIRKNRAKPAECLDICVKEQYRFAGVSKGGACACQNHIGHKKFSDDNCFSTCLAGGTGCGGPYAASVYSFQGNIDLNECRGNTHDCDHISTNCVNTAKSYRCECREGFRYLNRTHCRDADECEDNSHECERRSTYCINTIGGYRCECSVGYQRLDHTHCTDVDECGHHGEDCGEHTKCINTVGSYRCDCLPGFKMLRGSCADVDECVDNMNDCVRSSTFCQNTIGGYVCECRSGYQPLDRIRCKDIDECYMTTGRPECGQNKQCTNTVGSFTCDCVPGYKQAGDRCQDVDECVQHMDDCDRTATDCTNTVGGFHCACKLGFHKLDRTRCVDIDECQTRRAGCARCTNTIGSYHCDCIPGYQLTIQGCVDINECQGHSHACSPNSECENSEGGYACICQTGYTRERGSHTTCIDVNECLDPELNDCRAAHSRCHNTEGSYTCLCDLGFSGDGRGSCQDADECRDGTTRCADHAMCANTIGSFTCTCKAGYSGNGQVCGEVITLEDLEALMGGESPEHKGVMTGLSEHYPRTKFEPVKADRTELKAIFEDITERPGVNLADVDQWLGQEVKAKPGSVDEYHKRPPQVVNDGFALEDTLSSIEKSLSDVRNSVPGPLGVTETSLDAMLEEVEEHEKALVDGTKSPHVHVATPEPHNTGSDEPTDPVIMQAAEAVVNNPHHKHTHFHLNSVIPDKNTLDYVLGESNVPPEVSDVTYTNMDSILDGIIIHEKGLADGNFGTPPPLTDKPTLPASHPEAGDKKDVVGIQPKTNTNSLAQGPTTRAPEIDFPRVPPPENDIEDSNDLFDITAEIKAARAWPVDALDSNEGIARADVGGGLDIHEGELYPTVDEGEYPSDETNAKDMESYP